MCTNINVLDIYDNKCGKDCKHGSHVNWQQTFTFTTVEEEGATYVIFYYIEPATEGKKSNNCLNLTDQMSIFSVLRPLIINTQ